MTLVERVFAAKGAWASARFSNAEMPMVKIETAMPRVSLLFIVYPSLRDWRVGSRRRRLLKREENQVRRA